MINSVVVDCIRFFSLDGGVRKEWESIVLGGYNILNC